MMMEQNAKKTRDKPGNSTRNQKEAGNDDGTECQKTRGQAPEPYPKQDGTRK